MALGPLISLLLRSLPDILFLWRRHAERNDKEEIHENENEFRGTLAQSDLDHTAVLLERRLREARRVSD